MKIFAHPISFFTGFFEYFYITPCLNRIKLPFMQAKCGRSSQETALFLLVSFSFPFALNIKSKNTALNKNTFLFIVFISPTEIIFKLKIKKILYGIRLEFRESQFETNWYTQQSIKPFKRIFYSELQFYSPDMQPTHKF